MPYPVGQKEPNPWGSTTWQAMSGNGAGIGMARMRRRLSMTRLDTDTGAVRVLRGGAFWSGPAPAVREPYRVVARGPGDVIGFRVVRRPRRQPCLIDPLIFLSFSRAKRERADKITLSFVRHFVIPKTFVGAISPLKTTTGRDKSGCSAPTAHTPAWPPGASAVQRTPQFTTGADPRTAHAIPRNTPAAVLGSASSVSG